MSQKKSIQIETAIAVVGMAFRFPGDLGSESELWQALSEGRDMVSHIPGDRWDTDRLQHPKRAEPGRSNTFAAGVLSRVDQFDAAFFGISPREAAWMDPQQRLLLELAWESLENSGIAPSSIAGSNAAVYVGISSTDYGIRATDDIASVTSHTMTGNTLSIAANRISYVFDLHGPSLAVDTACSSSLVALHSACTSLRNGESPLALVGGVSLLLHPFGFVGFTKASMLSHDGQCRAFDASGAGYVRGEGGAVFVLKPLKDALANGDTVHAVILATGANSDGGRKTGITIPSIDGQTDLMQSVLERSGLHPNDIDYIEAHGTGTIVGDPIETAAIGKVYGRTRSDGRTLPIGSVKTNLGHLEPASGLAGLTKAILVLKNRAVPPSLHMETPNPRIDFAELNLEVVTELRPVHTDDEQEPIVVGVNSFGFGGSNAHVLVQEFKPQPAKENLRASAELSPLVLSARSPQALIELSCRYAELIRRHPERYYDIAYGAAFRRERMEKRLAVRLNTADEIAAELELFAQGQSARNLCVEDRLLETGSVAFVYAGNGAQWLGMGRSLLSESPRFSQIMQSLDGLIAPQAGFSIIEELHEGTETSRLQDTAVAQPLLFAMQVSLTIMLRERGVDAAAVTGHSVGEVAAAWAAGALSLDQAVQVICARSAAQARTSGTGRMAAVGLSEQAMTEWLTDGYPNIEIGGINSPKNVTVSGPLESLELLGAKLRERRVVFRLLDLDYAFHSRAMDPIQDGLLQDLVDLVPVAHNQKKFVSSVTGGLLAGGALDANYWWANVRNPVQFDKAITTLAELGCRVFIEISPHAILQRYIGESLKAAGVDGRILPTLRKDDDGLARLEEAALRAQLLVEPQSLGQFFPIPGKPIELPNYPWQRERHWHPRTAEAADLFIKRRIHPLLGWRVIDASTVWENVLDPESFQWLADHKVGTTIVFPGTGYLEMALAAAREHFGGATQELEEMDILAPIVFDGEHARSVRFYLNPRDAGFQIFSRQRLSNDEWGLNAVGRLLGTPTRIKTKSPEAPEGMVGTVTEIDHTLHYQLMQTLGLDYGPSFQGFASSVVRGQHLTGTLNIPELVQHEVEQYLLHPALLDACLQSLAGFFHTSIASGHGVPFLPVKVGRLRLFSAASPVQFNATLRRQGTRSILVDFELRDSEDNIVAILNSCRFRAAAMQRRKTAEPSCWANLPLLKPLAADQTTADLGSNHALTKALRRWFAERESSLDRSAYIQEASPLLEALTVSFIYDAFAQALQDSPQRVQLALNQRESVQTQSQPYFKWMADLLQQEGLLIQTPDGSFQLQSAELPPARHIWQTLLRDYPLNVPELVLAARIGCALPNLVRKGEPSRDFLEKLMLSRQFQAMFDDSPTYRGTTLAMQKALQTIAQNLPANRRLRVLEFVSGANSCVQTLMEQVPGVPLDYVVVHAEEDGRDRLKLQYADFPFVVVAEVSDHGLSLAGQGPIPDQFDVILFRHTLHSQPHPVGMLASARRKLVSGGLLLVAERHADVIADFLFGLNPNWWRSEPSGAPVSSLHPPKAWEQALVGQEFVEVETFWEPANEGLAAGAYVVLGRRSSNDVVPAEGLPAASWLLMCDSAGNSRAIADSLTSKLQSQGQRVLVVPSAELKPLSGQSTFDPAVPSSLDALLVTTHAALGKVDHIVYLANTAPTQSDAVEGGVSTMAHTGKLGLHTVGLMHLVQAIGRAGTQSRVWVVTHGGALVEGLDRKQPVQMEPAAMWGLGRVVMNEFPTCNLTLVDLDMVCHSNEVADRLLNEFLTPDGEREIILSRQERYVPRLERVSPQTTQDTTKDNARYRLDFLLPGQLRNLMWLPNPETSLTPDEVEVRVVATGLNFRDVMYVMGLLPDEAVENGYAGASLGLEFSGVVTRVGKVGGEFAVGDPVIGFGSSCFSSHVVTHSLALTHKPAEWSFEAAATVPTVFFTVYYALKHLADLQPGERVLIHGAAGGVGIAAVQLALHLGAEIYATVGSDEKRDFVTLLGADHVFDSRSMDFADEILALTGGEGVDVVLNSLAGEAIRRNLRALKPFGRFLELGKRDFFENTPIGLRPFKDNISYFGIDADQLQLARPALAGRLFREVMALFREGELFPLPHKVYPAAHVVEAFRAMQQSRHIGKVVVAMDDSVRPTESPAHQSRARVTFSKDSTWLITGGIAGFGLESARWLAGRGVGRLVLLGRRGLQTPGATEAVESLEAIGAQVEVFACDVSQREEVQSVLTTIQRKGPPLKGVLHAAMVLDDALIANLDGARVHSVLEPKMLGAWNLHTLTVGLPLEHFVLYSSVSTAIGNPGQASYVAANAALESLATLRREIGLPATCIGWGPIGDAGYLSRNQAVKDSLASRMGAEPLGALQALDMLDYLLSPDARRVTTVADFEWSALSRILPSAQTPRFDSLRRNAGSASDSGAEVEDIQALLSGKTPDEVRNIIQGLVTREVSQVLCINPDRIDPKLSLIDLGMDSLMGVELALGLEKRFNIQLPTMTLSEGPTIDRVTSRIVDRLLGTTDVDGKEIDQAEAVVAAIVGQHGEEVSETEFAQAVALVRERSRLGA